MASRLSHFFHFVLEGYVFSISLHSTFSVYGVFSQICKINISQQQTFFDNDFRFQECCGNQKMKLPDFSVTFQLIFPNLI